MAMVLTTSDKLEIILDGAVTTDELDFIASYGDYDSSTPTFTPGVNTGTTNGATAVDLVTAPGTGQRMVTSIEIYNNDTASATVTVRLDESGTSRILVEVTLAEGEKLAYAEDGWHAYESTMAIKGTGGSSGDLSTFGSPVDDDFAKFTDADTVEGRSYSEVKADLSLEIGTDIQAWDDDLDDIAGLTPTDGNVIVGDGTDWVAESGDTVLTSIGLSTNLGDLTDAEAAQLENIGIETISNTQWGYLGAMSGQPLESESNDLSASVTWANVPDANITESSVTQHEDAIDHGNLAGLSTGADHSYIDQDVTSGSSPTLVGTNFSSIDADSLKGGDLDSTVGSPSDGNILVYRDAGTDWVLEAKPSGSSDQAMDEITDVTITSVGDNDIIAYDSGTSEYINQTASEAGFSSVATSGSHDDLTSVGASDHHTKYALTDDLASGEITQIQAINSVTITNTQWGYLGSMSGQPLESESNDLSSTVTWANVPDANITEGSVTQHEGAIDHGNLTGLSTGADHSYIDQDVTSGSSPTLDGTNFSTIDADSLKGGDLDSTVGSPSDGNILVFRDAGSDWILEAKPAGGSNPAMADITDVTITSVGDDEIISYDSGSSGYINQTAGELNLLNQEQSSEAEPSDPASGSGVIWVSNGTDFGDTGDLCYKYNDGSTVTKRLIIDLD